jgi:transposase-like protein
MAVSHYTAVSLKTLKAVFDETDYSEQNQAIATAVLVKGASVTVIANQYGVTRANVYKILNKISKRLNEQTTGASYAWVKATHNLPLAISRELSQWEDTVSKLPITEAEAAIIALQKALFKCRAQLMEK